MWGWSPEPERTRARRRTETLEARLVTPQTRKSFCLWSPTTLGSQVAHNAAMAWKDSGVSSRFFFSLTSFSPDPFSFWLLSSSCFWFLLKTVFGDQLNGLGTNWMGGEGPTRSKIREKNAPRFLNFLDLSSRYWDICKKTVFGTSWMGWGPVDWVGRLLPEAKFKIKCTSFFEFFWFEQPLLRYL